MIQRARLSEEYCNELELKERRAHGSLEVVSTAASRQTQGSRENKRALEILLTPRLMWRAITQEDLKGW